MNQPTATKNVNQNTVASSKSKDDADLSIKSPPKILKRRKRKPTMLQRKAISYLVAHGGYVSVAMRAAGYSARTARTPQKLTETEAFNDVLTKAGLDDEHLAEVHSKMVDAVTVESVMFHSSTKGKGKKKKYILPDVEYIQAEIACRFPDCEYNLVRQPNDVSIVAYVQVPAHHYRGRGLELAYKTKGHLKENKLDVSLKHVTTPEEKKFIDTVLNNLK